MGATPAAPARAAGRRPAASREFVPLRFVHMEAPLWRKGRTRSGPTLREAVLMHAVARLVLHPLIGEHPDLVGQDGRRGCGAVPERRAPTIWAAR